MVNRNASSSAFGWNFQANVAIVLMLENIREAKCVRVEGADEDIEITLEDDTKIYAQVKAVDRPDNASHVIDKLTEALETLSDASKKGDGRLFTYITNSINPFNDQKTIPFFTDRTHLGFDELPEVAQQKIKKIITKNGYTNLDVHKMDIRVIPFYGKDPKNRFKAIQAYVDDFLTTMNIRFLGMNANIMNIWQGRFFFNATISDTTISVSKEKMIWPLIVLVVEETAANEYKKDFDDDEMSEIDDKYKLIINQNTMCYKIISRILSDFRKEKISPKQFVGNYWKNYLDIVQVDEIDDDKKESLLKIILYRILTQRRCIQDIKRGVNL